MSKFRIILSAAATGLLATSALAAGPPSGVKAGADGYVAASGLPLYTWDNDTMVGMSHCFADCAKAWPPLIASAKAKASGDWSLVKREDGALQWAYKTKPLYTCARDTVGKPATCVEGGWRPAK
ncbi:COG4315 family predicted lipoprotein [Phenylobacterium sp.]|uniref:COG4315 family predicted lipoprotein n=1 Tax=Phenylobacterium sp. TaxID=1871053 RepID=UPI003D289ED7